MKNSESKIGYVIFMAAVAALGGILFGYDTAVISGTTALVRNQFTLNDLSEGWYVGCALVGSICGVLAAGWLSDYLGRKLTMLIAGWASELFRLYHLSIYPRSLLQRSGARWFPCTNLQSRSVSCLHILPTGQLTPASVRMPLP